MLPECISGADHHGVYRRLPRPLEDHFTILTGNHTVPPLMLSLHKVHHQPFLNRLSASSVAIGFNRGKADGNRYAEFHQDFPGRHRDLQKYTLRSLSEMPAEVSISVSGMMTRNSSPPIRATISTFRTFLTTRWESSIKNFIPSGMAIGIIHGLEEIDIKNQQ